MNEVIKLRRKEKHKTLEYCAKKEKKKKEI